jgi:Protein of unknown function (DUF2807).
MRKLIYLFILTIIILSMGCVSSGITGNGITEKRTFDVKDFENITLIGKMRISIVQGREYKLDIELDSNLFNVFDAYVSNATLHLGFNKGSSIRHYHTCNIWVQLPYLTSVDITGSGNTAISGFVSADKEIKIVQKGSGITNINAAVKKLEIEASGSGMLTAKGNAETLSFNGRGSGVFQAFELQSNQVNITHTGSGDIEVAVKNSLQADLFGSGCLRYKGYPSRIIIHSSGSATVERVENE